MDPVVTPPAADTPWHTTLAPELRGVLETRGWKDMPVAEAAGNILKSYRELELRHGVPPEQLLKLPAKDAVQDPDGWAAVYRRLGAPEKAEDYKFEGVNDGLASAIRDTAAKHHVPVAMAEAIASAVKSHYEAGAAETATAAAELAAQNDKELTANWGRHKEANLHVARQAIAKTGATPEVVAALEKGIGAAKVLEFFRKIGSNLREDQFVETGMGNGPLSRDQAIAEKQSLMKDHAWVQRKLANGKAENERMTYLNSIIVGGDL